MSAPLVLSIQNATVRFSNKPIFENLSFNIHQGNKIALVGRNGAGKTTLMQMITGTRELDAGERWQEMSVRIGYLRQDVIPKPGQTIFDYIFEEIALGISPEEMSSHQYKVDVVSENLQIDPQWHMDKLSGGQLRRAALARALVEEPDILLLDEPTNHLDLEAIQWLEKYLKAYRGTLLCVSHDRTFLANITNKIFWLDRGLLKVCPRGFGDFDNWSTMLLEQEARELQNRKSIVAQEVEWASRGVPARRKRNMRRVALVKEMRDKLKADQSSYRRVVSKIALPVAKEAETSSRVVAEFYNVGKTFTADNGKETIILDKFNMRILRGERIGILGKNGSGKTTFLRMLTGEIKPDTGSVKISKTAEISYFDQKRRDLDNSHSLWHTLCPTGGDHVNVNGKSRHVCGYLKDFLFDPAMAHNLVGTLSGGEKNRLLLAKILANPGNFLILDEPTNDLDIDTLDMLEETLSNYPGTLFVVSHDRDFLDQTVTKIIAFEGNGEVEGYIGGYSDYLEAAGKIDASYKPESVVEKKPGQKEKPKPEAEKPKAAPKPGKLSYKLERELEQLPEKIEKVETDITEFSKKLSDANFYQTDPDGFHDMTKQLGDAQARLDRYENRWLELEALKTGA